MPQLTVGKENSGDIELYYEDHGTGRPIVLIHGWPLSGRSWEKQLPALLDAGYRVITYDRRGFGWSSQPTEGYNYDVMANDLKTLMDTLQLNDVTLVGFSMGGGEVARYLGQYGSAKVRQAVFIAAIPPALLQTPENPNAVDQKVFDGIQDALRADRPAFLKKFFANFYNVDLFHKKRISDESLDVSWNIAVQASLIGSIQCVTAWGEDFRNDIRSIQIPTLVIHGDDDRIVPLNVSGERTAEMINGSRLHVIKGAPHGLTLTHADELNEVLLSFVNEAQPALSGNA